MLWKHKEGIPKLFNGIIGVFPKGIIYMEIQRIRSQAMMGREMKCFMQWKMVSKGSEKTERRTFWRPVGSIIEF